MAGPEISHRPLTRKRHSQEAWLLRLLRDRAGNTLAIIAAAMLPLLAIIGGGIDMGRG